MGGGGVGRETRRRKEKRRGRKKRETKGGIKSFLLCHVRRPPSHIVILSPSTAFLVLVPNPP